jgi:hypothetical protein
MSEGAAKQQNKNSLRVDTWVVATLQI